MVTLRPASDAAGGVSEPAPDDAAEVDEAPGPGRYGFPKTFHPWREGAMVCAVVGILVALVYQIWHLHLNIPISYNGDGTFNAMMTKSIRENGWLLSNPRLGAPFHGTLYDFPQGGENAQFALEKLIGFVTPSYGATLNTFVFSTYFLVALSAYFAARYLKLGAAASVIVATLYAFLPYHVWHGETHATRAGFYIVPLVVLVFLWLVDYRTRYCEDGRFAFARHRWRFVAALAICLVLGGSDTQNSLFAVSILGTVAILLAFAHRDYRPLALGAVLCIAILGSLGANNLPTVLYARAHGRNTVVAKRTVTDVDSYSLSISRMLLPNRGYRIGKLARLETRARTEGVAPGEPGEALGTFGAIGLLATLIVAGMGMFRPRRRDDDARAGPDSPATEPLLARLGGASLVAILFATTGGLSALLALAGFTSERTWNRIVVYIGACSLLGLGLLFDRLFRAVRGRLRGRTGVAVIAAIAVVVIGLGALDQTSPANVPHYAATARTYHSDDAFFTTLEARLPHASMVFQYPIMKFPESDPSGSLFTSDQLIGYLHTKDLRWSYGAMNGRPESDWQQVLNGIPTRTALYGLAASGFAGVYINRLGYTSAGPAFENAVRTALGPPMLVSPNQQLVYYDLTPLRRQLDQLMSSTQRRALRDAILHPVTNAPGTGFYPLETKASESWQWTQPDAQTVLHNDTSRPVTVRVTARFGGRPGTVTITGLGAPRALPIGPTPTPFDATVSVPPGATTVRFHTDAPRTVAPHDTRSRFLQVFAFTVQPPALASALCRFEAGPSRPASCPPLS